MMNKGHVKEWIPAYTLGCLDEDELSLVSTHIVACSECRAELASYQALVDRLAWAAPERMPSAGLKHRIMAQLPARYEGNTPEQPLPWWRGMVGIFQKAAPVWGIASLVLVVLLVVSNLWWWQADHEKQLMDAPSQQIVSMVSTDAAPGAVGTLVIGDKSKTGTLVVYHMPVLDEEFQYQLWLIRDGQRTSGGVFSVNLEGYGTLLVSAPDALSSYPDFGITIEPAGGSPGPTGDKVLGSSS